MRKLSCTLASAILLFSNVSCVSSPPDVPICVEDDIASAYCVHTISGKEFVIDDTHKYSPTGNPKDAGTWIDIRPFMLLMPVTSWIEIKKFIVTICKSSNQCNQAVANWERSVDAIDSRAASKQP